MSDDYDQLSDLGARQSTLLGEGLSARSYRIGRCVSGPMRRHKQTYEACNNGWVAAGNSPLPEPEVAAGLAEYDFQALVAAALVKPTGELQHAVEAWQLATQNGRQTPREMSRLFQAVLEATTRAWISGTLPDPPETWAAFKYRVVTALDDLTVRAEHDGGELTAIFTSGGPVAVAVGNALGLRDEQILAHSWLLRNASLCEIVHRADQNLVLSFNNTFHLPPDMLTWR